MRLTNRPGRVLASALSLGLVLGACGSEGSSDSNGSSDTTDGESSAAAAEGTIASTFVLGGPPECPERPLCLLEALAEVGSGRDPRDLVGCSAAGHTDSGSA